MVQHGLLGTLPVAVLIYYMIGKGKNWARLTFSVLAIVGNLLVAVEFFRHPPVSGWLGISRVSFDIAEMGVEVGALALLFQRVSSDWFRALSDPRTNPLKSVLSALGNTDQPMLSYVWRAWLIAFIPTIVIAPIAVFTMPDKFPIFDGPIAITLLLILLLAPWAETLLMWPILWILKRTIKKTLWVAAVSAAIWGLLHAASFPAQGLTITWAFFVFSLCFLEWEKKCKGRAIKVTAMVHMCHNIVPAFIIVLSVLIGAQSPAREAVPPSAPPQHKGASISAGKAISSAGTWVPATPSKKTEGIDVTAPDSPASRN